MTDAVSDAHSDDIESPYIQDSLPEKLIPPRNFCKTLPNGKSFSWHYTGIKDQAEINRRRRVYGNITDYSQDHRYAQDSCWIGTSIFVAGKEIAIDLIFQDGGWHIPHGCLSDIFVATHQAAIDELITLSNEHFPNGFPRDEASMENSGEGKPSGIIARIRDLFSIFYK